MNIFQETKKVYNAIYKNNRLEKLIKSIEQEQQHTKDFLRNYDPFSVDYCSIRHDKCLSCGLMAWQKDKNHKYINANEAHLKIFYELSLIDLPKILNKTDEELITEWRKKTNTENTFGEMCFSTDDYVKSEGIPCRFFEFGYKNGKPLLLDVYKKPIYDENNIFNGTFGNAIDMSDKENDIVELLDLYINSGVAKRLDLGKTKDVAAYRLIDRRSPKRFNRVFP